MSESNKLPQGVLISGVCKGYRSTIRGDYTNESIGIAIQMDDGYGGVTETIEEISIYGDAKERIKAQAETMKGKNVVISVLRRAMKSDRTQNAYLSQGIHANSNLIQVA